MGSLLGVSESASAEFSLFYTKRSSFDLYIQTYQDLSERPFTTTTCRGGQSHATRRLPCALERTRLHHTVPRRSVPRTVGPRSYSDSVQRARRQKNLNCSGI